MVVDPSDPAFAHPTKPIGLFYTKEEADQLAAENGYTYVEDAGRGYRRVVPSPLPRKIVELPTVEHLLAAGEVVIDILPALPKEWAKGGSFRGLCARGGWVVDCAWKDGTPVNVVVRPANGRIDRRARPEVRFGGRPLGFTMKEVLK